MQVWPCFLAASAFLVAAHAAQACELPAGSPDNAPIETRKPLRGDDVRLTSGFGLRRHPLLETTKMHIGVDWSAVPGTPVIAAGRGRVNFAAVRGDYGNAVVIDHGGGWQTLYGQLLRIDVRQGDCVEFGALVGRVGSTGLSAGPHLHFEVLRDGTPLDPMRVHIKNAPDENSDPK
jgi:murein DD-endopeptidase MepM/ murein hydrolase activator NlpD